MPTPAFQKDRQSRTVQEKAGAHNPDQEQAPGVKDSIRTNAYREHRHRHGSSCGRIPDVYDNERFREAPE